MRRGQIDRRHLLQGLGLAAVAPYATAPAQAHGKKIIVIGAGLAGLAAAKELAAAGADVSLLEARDRIGGRIWTSRQWDGLPIDMGASWIHGITGNPLTALADAGGIKRLATSYDASLMLDASGKAVELDDAIEAADDAIAAARREADASARDVSLAAAITASSAWEKAGEAERRLIMHQISGTVEAEYGGGWAEASAWRFDEAREFEGGDELFPGGFDQVTAFLAKGLTVRLGQKVTSLSPLRRGVSVALADGQSIEADHAIITVPLGVLKAGGIRFAEPLLPARQQAIGSIGMGLLNKCWLKFDRIAWPGDVDWIEWLGPEAGRWSQWLSLARVAGEPVLLAFHAAGAARALEQLDDRQVMAEAHEALKAMFGSGFPAPQALQLSRWSRDELALGSYSFNAVGVSAKTRQALAGPDWRGRLVFAGEAAEPQYFGTAHGALLSGRQAAKLLLLR